MPVNQSFLDMLLELLAPAGAISVRRMFGGASLYADGVLFALVDDDVLYLKADETTSARYQAEGLKPFTYEGQTGPVSMSYWRAPERLYDDHDQMLEWTREALAVARMAAARKAAKARPKLKPAGKRAKS
ncbi:MAG: TfoX/Sxy family protein [Hyphomicrobium sp.]